MLWVKRLISVRPRAGAPCEAAVAEPRSEGESRARQVAVDEGAGAAPLLAKLFNRGERSIAWAVGLCAMTPRVAADRSVRLFPGAEQLACELEGGEVLHP